MNTLILNRKLAQLAILQRIELASPKLKNSEKYLADIYFQNYFQNT